MAENIEHRVQALQGYPLNDDIANDQEQYRFWVLANFGIAMTDNTSPEQRECHKHIDAIAGLQETSYSTTLLRLQYSRY